MNQSDISGGSVEEKRRIKERAWKGPTKKKTWFSEDVEIFLIVEIEKEYENRRVGYLTRWIKSLGGMQRHEVTYLWSPSQKNFFFFSFCSRWLRVLRTTVSENGWRAKEGVRRVSRKSRHDLWSDSWTDICSAAISRQRATACLLEQDTVENVDKYGNEPVKSSISRNTRDPKRDEEASTSTKPPSKARILDL